jgi:hypothetical protein
LKSAPIPGRALARAQVEAANPIPYVSKDDPPSLILRGTGSAGLCLHRLPGWFHADKRLLSSENEKLVSEFLDSAVTRS